MVKRHLLLKHLNKTIELETGRGTIYKGKIMEYDDWGIHFIPLNTKFKPVMISWNDLRKIIIPDNGGINETTSRTSIF